MSAGLSTLRTIHWHLRLSAIGATADKRRPWGGMLRARVPKADVGRAINGLTRGLSQCTFEPIRCPVLSIGEAMRRRDNTAAKQLKRNAARR